MTIGFADRTRTKLTEGVTSTATLLPCWGGDLAQFRPGNADTYVVIRDALSHEVVKVVGIQPFTGLLVERGQDGSTPRAFAAGSIVSARVAKGALSSFLQKGAMRQIAYNPNAVTMPSYFGEKIAETGVDGCARRIWQNVVEGSAQWRIVYGDMCKDLQNYREWDWPDVEYPWPEWPTPLPGIMPDMWLDASRYDYADGVDLSYLDDSYWYSGDLPLSEIVNPVYDHVNDTPFLSVSTGGAFGARPTFSREKFSGLNAFNFTCVGHKRPEFGTLYSETSSVTFSSPAKVIFLVADIDFSASGDAEVFARIKDANTSEYSYLMIRNCSGSLKMWADIVGDNSVWSEWKTLSPIAGPVIYALRYDLRESFNLAMFANGVDIGAAVDGLGYAASSHNINEMRVSAENLSGCSYTPAATHTTPAYVCEFQVFDRWLTDTQMAAQTDFLKKKWSIA